MLKNFQAIVLIIALASLQFSCVTYVEKTQRKNSETVEGIRNRRDVKAFSVLEFVSKKGVRHTFLKGRPGTIRDGRIEGETLVENSLQLRQEDISRIIEQSPEMFVAESTDGNIYYFDTYSRENETFIGKGRISMRVSMPLEEIEAAWINYKIIDRERSRTKTISTIGLAVAAWATIEFFTHAGEQSCPFIYSFNGEDWVCDAEPYSGSIFRGGQRTEWCLLDHIEPVRGQYRILATNELKETEFIDQLALVAVDHPQHTIVVPDAWGRIHSISDPIPPLDAVDKRLNPVTEALSANDRMLWLAKDGMKDELVIRFPRPRDAARAKLVFVGQNTSWGPLVISRYLGLYGEKLQDFYREVNNRGPAYYMMLGMHLREELFSLKVRVDTNAGWQERGLIIGAPPQTSDLQVAMLDLSGVEGDVVEIKLTPPAHFWKINYVAIDYSEDLPLKVVEIEATSARDQLGRDVRDTLRTADGQYLEMPHIGDQVEMSFAVPATEAGMERTVLLRASGYYEIHLDNSGPRQDQLLYRIHTEPGFALAYSQEQLKQ